MHSTPYRLLIGSHKGGTGQTTAAVALAWSFGQLGWEVDLVDADPVQSASMLAQNEHGECTWPNVRLHQTTPEELPTDANSKLMIIDGPALTDPAARPLLQNVHGVVLTCLADPLSLRTVPSAAKAIRTAKLSNPQLSLLGLMIAIYEQHDPIQPQMLQMLRKQYQRFMLEPPVPSHKSLANWADQAGNDLPEESVRTVYLQLARNLGRFVTTMQNSAAESGV